MKLTLEKANEIRELFGPCTTIYECCGDEELKTTLGDDPDLTTGKFIRDQLIMEGMWAEQTGDAALIAEVEEAETGIMARLRAAGFSF